MNLRLGFAIGVHVDVDFGCGVGLHVDFGVDLNAEFGVVDVDYDSELGLGVEY